MSHAQVQSRPPQDAAPPPPPPPPLQAGYHIRSISRTPAAIASSFRARALRFFVWSLRWLWSLQAIVFSSDPARFLPPRRKHHRHTQSNASDTQHSRRSSTTAITLPSSAIPAVAAPARTSTPPPLPSSPQSTAPLIPFLSTSSFPLPSSSLPAARFSYVNDEVSWPLRLLPRISGGVLTRTSLGAGGAASGPTRSVSSVGSDPSPAHSRRPSSTTLSSPGVGGVSIVGGAHKKRWTLVLDLDETLVHTTDSPSAEYDCRVEIRTRRAHRVFYILKRPYLDTFLATLSTAFEIVIFTASIRRYADAVIDLVDVNRVVGRRYFRPHCVKSGSSFLKDLRSLSTSGDLRRTVLIDNSPVAYTLQPENALPISTWIGAPEDTALRDLIPFLLALRACDDLRPLLYRRHVLQRAVEEAVDAEAEEAVAAATAGAPQIPATSAIIEEDEGDLDLDDDDELDQTLPVVSHARHTLTGRRMPTRPARA